MVLTDADEDDLPFGLSEFPETESEEAQRLAEKKAARDTVDVCTTVMYTKPLLLHAFPPVLPTYEEMEPFLRSRHPGLEQDSHHAQRFSGLVYDLVHILTRLARSKVQHLLPRCRHLKEVVCLSRSVSEARVG